MWLILVIGWHVYYDQGLRFPQFMFMCSGFKGRFSVTAYVCSGVCISLAPKISAMCLPLRRCAIAVLHIYKRATVSGSERGPVVYITPCVDMVFSWYTLHMYSTREWERWWLYNGVAKRSGNVWFVKLKGNSHNLFTIQSQRVYSIPARYEIYIFQ